MTDLYPGRGVSLCSTCFSDPKCKYFLVNDSHGSCEMSSRFMCEEWEKYQPGYVAKKSVPDVSSNSLLAPRTQGLAGGSKVVPGDSLKAGVAVQAQAPLPPIPRNLFGEPIPDPEPSGHKPPRRRWHGIPKPPVGDGPEALQSTPPTIPEAWVTSLAEQGIETKLDVSGQEVVLVPKRTGQDRLELTYQEGVVLGECLRAFPGARLVAMTKSGPMEEFERGDDDE